ncbi:hypothetical protein V8F44DRAFT_361401 [Aspergillus fumigatus]
MSGRISIYSEKYPGCFLASEWSLVGYVFNHHLSILYISISTLSSPFIGYCQMVLDRTIVRCSKYLENDIISRWSNDFFRPNGNQILIPLCSFL